MALRKMPGGKSDICLMRLKICEIVEDLVLYNGPLQWSSTIVEDLGLYNLANFGKTKMKT